MSYLVQAALPSSLVWLMRRTGWALSPHARGIEAVDNAGQLRGVVAFDGWTRNSCHVHVVLDTASAGRALLRPAFEYGFIQAERGVLLGVIAADNPRSLNLARHLGFSQVTSIRDGAAPGVNLILFEMRRESCRWLSGARTHRKAA